MDAGWKLCLKQLACVLRSLIQKISGAPIFIHKVMFMVGYYNELIVVLRQIVYKVFAKENSFNH